MSDHTPPNAPEIATLFICPNCDRLSFLDELEQPEKEQDKSHRRMVCANCQGVVSADHIHDYALFGGVHFE